jgi:hypothetical protein
MAFTTTEIANIATAALDFYMNRGKTFQQSIQNKPLLKVMEDGKKTFPGGKGNISLSVKGVYGAGGVGDSVVGYTHNDAVSFYTPANLQRVNYPWREHHIGLTLTHTELKIDGISVTDEEGDGSKLSKHSDREMTVLTSLLEDKLQDFGEQYAITMNRLLWGDGTTDAKALAGVRSIIVDAPTLGTLGGLTRTTNTWWRNRAATAANAAQGGQGAITSNTAAGGALLTFLQNETRQLIRYGARPDTFFCGSAFLSAMETETRANGNYSMTGFTGPQDGGVGPVAVGFFKPKYDPTLDDLGYSKRMYAWDSRFMYLAAMEEEWRHMFTPSRPNNQFVMYKSMTNTGQMVAAQVNGSAVYDIN